jgi:hypothetical protein
MTLFWREDVWDVPDHGDPVLVRRRGNVLYQYRTADDDRREQHVSSGPPKGQ